VGPTYVEEITTHLINTNMRSYSVSAETMKTSQQQNLYFYVYDCPEHAQA
jgi:hypothetical protein